MTLCRTDVFAAFETLHAGRLACWYGVRAGAPGKRCTGREERGGLGDEGMLPTRAVCHNRGRPWTGRWGDGGDMTRFLAEMNAAVEGPRKRSVSTDR